MRSFYGMAFSGPLSDGTASSGELVGRRRLLPNGMTYGRYSGRCTPKRPVRNGIQQRSAGPSSGRYVLRGCGRSTEAAARLGCPVVDFRAPFVLSGERQGAGEISSMQIGRASFGAAFLLDHRKTASLAAASKTGGERCIPEVTWSTPRYSAATATVTGRLRSTVLP